MIKQPNYAAGLVEMRRREIMWRIAEKVADGERRFCRAVGYDWTDSYLISWAEFDICMAMLRAPEKPAVHTRLRIIEGKGEHVVR